MVLARNSISLARRCLLNYSNKRLPFATRCTGHNYSTLNLSERNSLNSKSKLTTFCNNKQIINRNEFRYNQSAPKKIEQFILPDIGEGINEVVIRDWQVKVGDLVKEFDGLCEVESDKATATISSRYDGVIRKVYYQPGEMAKVGQPLVDIEVDDSIEEHSEAEVAQKQARVANEAKTPEIPVAVETNQVSTLPSVRRLAKEHGIDLSRIRPSGRNNRILKEDVLAYLEQGTKSELGTEDGKKFGFAEQLNAGKAETVIPLRGIQKAMIKTMSEALKIPHFNYSDEIDLSKLIKFNKQLKESNGGVVNSNLAFIIKMTSLALLEYPQLNATLDQVNQESLIQKNYHNIGVAVDTKAGLIVPNIKNVQQLTIQQINSELTRLRELGYNSKLGLQDLSNGTITLSNIGAIGGTFGVPVILPPEILIGALGRIRKLPRFNERGSIEECHIMQIVWSADHRVVDGATLSRFSNLLKLYLEEPINALSKMA